MDNFKEVKEYDVITCNKEYENSILYQYIEQKQFDELIEFIYEFNKNEENNDILNFMKIGYKRNIGKTITIKNYVGLIQLKSGFKLQILPKISLGVLQEDNNNTQTKKIFLEMLKSMKEFPGKVFTSANLNIDRMNLYEIFINMYIQKVRELVKRGMKSCYVEKEENIPYFKGKLLVNKQINLNTFHREKFYMKFDEYSVNSPENKIIKSTLLKLQTMSTSAENIRQIKQVLISFELVKPSSNYQKDFSKIVINKNTKSYDTIIKWSKIFLNGKSFTTFSGKNFSRALLFPMEKVFEQYVAKYVRKVLKDFKVTYQDKGYYLFDNPKQFAIRPDLVIRGNAGRTIVMDVKWKRLYNQKKNYGISQADMYQMYVYAKKYKTPEIYLLYPANGEMKNHEQIKFISYDEGNQEVCIKVFFVEVGKERIEQSIKRLTANMIES